VEERSLELDLALESADSVLSQLSEFSSALE